jgi:hypothetical protein
MFASARKARSVHPSFQLLRVFDRGRYASSSVTTAQLLQAKSSVAKQLKVTGVWDRKIKSKSEKSSVIGAGGKTYGDKRRVNIAEEKLCGTVLSPIRPKS